MVESEISRNLRSALNAGRFEPFLRSIRFPHFKNLDENFEIEFTFPVTAIIGPNGCNKSSILRALQSCPEGSSISDYWFDSALDEIDERTGSQRYIHSYLTPSGATAEVRKQRVQKASRGDDYFETTRPRVSDGMAAMPSYSPAEDLDYRSSQRWKPIRKDVLYLDFRAILPAYDIYMGFNWRGQDNTASAKKRMVRLRAPRISDALASLASSSTFAGKQRLMGAAQELSEEEISRVNSILGKSYTEVRLVCHDYYYCEGWTALLKTDKLHYSEAFAGSGEFAVVKLVHDVSRAKDRSLILLDEPETSLHPKAQKALMSFLLNASLKRKHQIVMSTHSPSMVAALPRDARKLVAERAAGGKVFLTSQSATQEEAFERLGETYRSRQILVEDELAAEMIKRALRTKGKTYFNTIEVKPIPGGANTIKSRIAVDCALLDLPNVILLDGDQRPSDIKNPKDVVDDKLEEELQKYGVSKNNLVRNGGRDKDETKVLNSMRTTLNWLYWHQGYLPGDSCPEAFLLEMLGDEVPDSPDRAKEEWVERARIGFGYLEDEVVRSEEILLEQRRALASLDDDNCYLQKIADEVERLIGEKGAEEGVADELR